MEERYQKRRHGTGLEGQAWRVSLRYSRDFQRDLEVLPRGGEERVKIINTGSDAFGLLFIIPHLLSSSLISLIF